MVLRQVQQRAVGVRAHGISPDFLFLRSWRPVLLVTGFGASKACARRMVTMPRPGAIPISVASPHFLSGRAGKAGTTACGLHAAWLTLACCSIQVSRAA